MKIPPGGSKRDNTVHLHTPFGHGLRRVLTAAEVAGHVDASATIEEGTVLTASSTATELQSWLASLR